ncbi:tumor necrosis factor receptor superfamily member 5 [Colossoma macropomum]|uniref:tumor necrosis factor receptor superfamily member 5 n=1 Tax=Colossoma macropomum TaxID=42526 RepID=UPI001864F849|nr:tumor necrosis factor receptor superfamily member 5 [Colossoma macropomum]
MRAIYIILLVFPALVYSCNEREYLKDGQCCKMCGPGTRMKQNTDCMDPHCQPCENGEYQDGFTQETKCKQQPSCDPNLFFQNQTNPSKTERTQCQCMPDHHCSSLQCISCVRNTVCHPGEQVKKIGTQMSDTECEPCPEGKFSTTLSARTCLPWKECSSGNVESVPGSSTSDRICEPHSNVRLGVFIVLGLVIIAVVCGLVFYLYKRDRTGSACLEKKLQQHCPALFPNKPQPAEEKIVINVEQQPALEHQNEPEEDTEDVTKQDDHFKHGLSANGLPIDQDHSKMSFLSQPETIKSADGSYSDDL